MWYPLFSPFETFGLHALEPEAESAFAIAAESARLVYLEFNPYSSCRRDILQLWTDAISLRSYGQLNFHKCT